MRSSKKMLVHPLDGLTIYVTHFNHAHLATYLTFPNSTSDLVLNTDASATAVGAILFQVRNNAKMVPENYSDLTTAQKKYSTYGRELLAIYSTVKFFRHLIEHRSQTSNFCILAKWGCDMVILAKGLGNGDVIAIQMVHGSQ